MGRTRTASAGDSVTVVDTVVVAPHTKIVVAGNLEQDSVGTPYGVVEPTDSFSNSAAAEIAKSYRRTRYPVQRNDSRNIPRDRRSWA